MKLSTIFILIDNFKDKDIYIYIYTPRKIDR